MSVEHHREGIQLSVAETEVELTLDTGLRPRARAPRRDAALGLSRRTLALDGRKASVEERREGEAHPGPLLDPSRLLRLVAGLRRVPDRRVPDRLRVTLARDFLVRLALVQAHAHKTLGLPRFFPPLAEAQHEQCERKRDDRPSERLEGRLGSAEEAFPRDRLLATVFERDRAGDVIGTAPDRAHRRRELPLRQAEERREGSGEQRLRADGLGRADVRRQDRKGAPGERKPEVWRRRPPKSSRLYATTMNVPKTTNGSSNSVHAKAAARPIAAAPPIDAVASTTRVRAGIAVRRASVELVERMCADAEREEERAETPEQSLDEATGASAAPITT